MAKLSSKAMRADLHLHSVHSDGLLAPAAVIDAAAKAGLHCVALTDHDTVSGVPELLPEPLGPEIANVLCWKLRSSFRAMPLAHSIRTDSSLITRHRPPPEERTPSRGHLA